MHFEKLSANNNKWRGLFLILIFTGIFKSQAQEPEQRMSDANIHAEVGVMGIGTSNGQVPFWMRTNNYGSNPLDGVSGSLTGSIRKDYDTTTENGRRLWDWGGGVDARFNGGNKAQVQLITAYLKARLSIFQIQAGRTRDITGLVDTSLSSGAFSVSGNALGIPKVEISIPDYWTLPILNNLFSFKGNFAVGYVGDVRVNRRATTTIDSAKTFYHQKSLYGRLGNDNWKVKFYAGFNHQVFWGNDRQILGPGYTLNGIQAFWYVVSGKAYSANGTAGSKVGNHIGSIDQAISIDLKSLLIRGYHQFFYDVGGLAHLNNIKDGLWGLSIENKNIENYGDGVMWRKFLVEFLNSKSQGGELTAKVTPSGDEDYYNNFLHYTGWTYKGENIGNNFFTNKKYQRKNLPAYAGEYIGNNRIMLFHIGAEWQWNDWRIVNKFSFSRNYGTYATSPIGNTTGTVRNVQPPPYFYPVNQFSGYIEASRNLKKNYNIGFVFATDYGDLLYNSLGGMIRLTKSW